MKKNSARGFTLIELLVVIAIIAMLASIILASLNQARVKARDARRLADLKSVQNALEMYNSDNGSYPADIYAASNSLTPTYISAVPKDPQSNANYNYGPLSIGASSATCNSYHLGGTLEGANTALNGRVGANAAAGTTANNKGFFRCSATGATTDFDASVAGSKVYDIIP